MTAARRQHFTVSGHPLVRLALLGSVVILIDAVTPTLHQRYGEALFIALMAAQAAIAYIAIAEAKAAEARTALILVVGVAFVARGILLANDPYLSSDVFRYVWDGRVHGAGINPYLYIPAAPELAHLRDAAVYPNINRADYAPTIYPPTAQWVFYLVTRIADGMRAMKVAMVAFDAATMAMIVAILRRLNRPLVLVVAYAWHPLPIFEIAGNGHVDAVMVALLMASVWATLSGRDLLAGFLASLGALAKPTALLALPVIWRPWNWRLVALVIVTLVGMYLPFASAGSHVLGFAGGYMREEGVVNGMGPWLPLLFSPAHVMSTWFVVLYLGAGALLLSAIAMATGFRTDRSPEATLGLTLLPMLVFLDLLSTNYPWYFLVLTPFLSLTPAVAPWIATSTVFVLYNLIPGDMTAPPIRWTKIALYAAITIAIAFDLKTGRIPSGQKRDQKRGPAHP